MTSAPGLWRLVGSRMRYDGARHLAAVAAVALLLASVLVFQGISGGLGARLAVLVGEERPYELGYSQNTLYGDEPPVPESQLEAVRSWPDVVDVTGRRVAPSGIDRENTTGLIVIAGVDFEGEAAQMHEVAPPTPNDGLRFISFGNRLAAKYSLFEGQWPRDESEALITESLRRPGWMVGDAVEFAAPNGNRTVTIVGVVLNEHPAGYAVPGSATAGHLLVSDDLLQGVGFRSVHVTTERNYGAVRDVADRMRALWPESWRENKGKVEAFEERYYEATRAQAVLAAASRFVLLSGMATIFAMSLMLLNGERRALGVFQAVGLGSTRTTGYIVRKLALLIIGGILLGLAFGHSLLAYSPLPTLGGPLEPYITATQTVGVAASTLAAAALGAAVAAYLALREPPAGGLRLHE